MPLKRRNTGFYGHFLNEVKGHHFSGNQGKGIQ
jgi:hypothetical protein